MNSIDLINEILNATKPSDVFTDKDWNKTYLKYSKLIHPDYCKHENANDAMSKLNELKQQINNGVECNDDSGKYQRFDMKLIYTVTDMNKELLMKSVNNFKNILDIIKKDSNFESFRKYLPKSIRYNKEKYIVDFSHRAVPLYSLYPLEQIHVNWVYSRIHEFALFMKNNGLSHMGINPESVYIVPETHGIIITSFYHMGNVTEKAKTYSAKYKNWYPTKLFSNKKLIDDTDLELAKKCAIYLLGDKSGGGNKLKFNDNINKEILSFYIESNYNDFDTYKRYRMLLKKNFKSKFYKLNV